MEKLHLWRLRPLSSYTQSSSTEMEASPCLLPGPGWGQGLGPGTQTSWVAAAQAKKPHEGATRQTAYPSQIGFHYLAGLSYRMDMNEELTCTEAAPQSQVSVIH